MFRGGGERYPLEIARELSKREEVVFASIQDRRDAPVRGVTAASLAGWSLTAPPLFSELNPIPTLSTFVQIKELLNAHARDLEFIHVHNLRTASTASWLAMATSHPSRSRFRILLTDHGARFMPFPRRWARRIDFYAAVSKYSLHQLQSWARRPGMVVPVFVANALLDLSNRMKGEERDIDLLYMGRLLPWKRADLLLELIPKIEDILGRGIRVTIAGSPSDPAYLARLRSLAERRASRSRVDFVLSPDDAAVAGLYAQSRLFALLSTRTDPDGGRVPVPELAPFTPIEAAAFGTPSVVSAIPGLDEQVQADRTGLLVEPEQLDATAAQVASILSDESRWNELSRNASAFVRTERTADAVARLLESYLDRIRRGEA